MESEIDTKEEKKDDLKSLLYSGRPLDDTMIYQIRKATNKVKGKEVDDIYVNCNKRIHQLLNLSKKHMENVTSGRVNSKGISTISTIQQMLKLVPKDEVFLRMFPKIIAHEQYIVEKNGDYFIKQDFNKLIKDDSKKNFIHQIMSIIKNEYVNLKPADNETLWEIMNGILGDCAVFREKINAVI